MNHQRSKHGPWSKYPTSYWTEETLFYVIEHVPDICLEGIVAMEHIFGTGCVPRSLTFQVNGSQQTRDIDPMLEQCWASVVDGSPTFKQHWVDVSFFPGSLLFAEHNCDRRR